MKTLYDLLHKKPGFPEEKKDINTSVHQNQYAVQDSCRDLGFNEAHTEFVSFLKSYELNEAEIWGIIRPLFDKFNKDGLMMLYDQAEDLSLDIAKSICNSDIIGRVGE